MSFIATFLVVLITNKMNLLDSPYIAVPHKLQDNLGPKDTKLIVEAQEGNECIVEQEPISSLSTASPASLFFSLNFVGADVFEHQKNGDNQIIPGFPYRDANDYFKAFGIPCPEAVLIKNNGSLQIILSPKKKNTCRKSKVFAVRPYASTEAIKTKKAEGKKQGTEDDKQQTEDNNENLTGNNAVTTQDADSCVQPKKVIDCKDYEKNDDTLDVGEDNKEKIVLTRRGVG